MKVMATIAMLAAFAVGASAPSMAQYGGNSGPTAGGGAGTQRTMPMAKVGPMTGASHSQRVTPNQNQRIMPNQNQRVMPNQAQRVMPNQTQGTQTIIVNPNAAGRF